MDFLNPMIQNYADHHTAFEPEYLKELNRYTHLNVLKPRMLSGHFQGRFLSFISQMIGAKNILDIGTYTGYSALCLAEGLSKDGFLHTIDNNEELAPVSSDFFSKSPFSKQIISHLGQATAIIPQLNQNIDFWDIVWIDADKFNYLEYYHLVIDKVRKGGIIMADNVLWSGKVCEEQALINDEDTKSLDVFNKTILHDQRVNNLLLPIRDGIMMMRKQ